MSILLILLSSGSRCHILTPFRDRRPRRSIPSQERPLLATSRTSSANDPCATSVRPVPTVPVRRPCVQCQRRIPDARALTRHAPVHMPVASAPPRARPHTRTLTPVRANETARVGSDTILTDQHKSFLRTLSSLVRTREEVPGRSLIPKLLYVKHA